MFSESGLVGQGTSGPERTNPSEYSQWSSVFSGVIPGSLLQDPTGTTSTEIVSPMNNMASGFMTNQFITNAILVDGINTKPHYISPLQPHFISTKPTKGAAHTLLSISMANFRLAQRDWREKYGNEATMDKFMRDWMMYGIIKNEVPATVIKDKQAYAISIVTGGRVKMTQLNQSMEIATSRTSGVKKGDYIYIVAVKYPYFDPIHELRAPMINMKESIANRTNGRFINMDQRHAANKDPANSSSSSSSSSQEQIQHMEKNNFKGDVGFFLFCIQLIIHISPILVFEDFKIIKYETRDAKKKLTSLKLFCAHVYLVCNQHRKKINDTMLNNKQEIFAETLRSGDDRNVTVKYKQRDYEVFHNFALRPQATNTDIYKFFMEFPLSDVKQYITLNKLEDDRALNKRVLGEIETNEGLKELISKFKNYDRHRELINYLEYDLRIIKMKYLVKYHFHGYEHNKLVYQKKNEQFHMLIPPFKRKLAADVIFVFLTFFVKLKDIDGVPQSSFLLEEAIFTFDETKLENYVSLMDNMTVAEEQNENDGSINTLPKISELNEDENEEIQDSDSVEELTYEEYSGQEGPSNNDSVFNTNEEIAMPNPPDAEQVVVISGVNGADAYLKSEVNEPVSMASGEFSISRENTEQTFEINVTEIESKVGDLLTLEVEINRKNPDKQAYDITLYCMQQIDISKQDSKTFTMTAGVSTVRERVVFNNLILFKDGIINVDLSITASISYHDAKKPVWQSGMTQFSKGTSFIQRCITLAEPSKLYLQDQYSGDDTKQITGGTDANGKDTVIFYIRNPFLKSVVIGLFFKPNYGIEIFEQLSNCSLVLKDIQSKEYEKRPFDVANSIKTKKIKNDYVTIAFTPDADFMSNSFSEKSTKFSRRCKLELFDGKRFLSLPLLPIIMLDVDYKFKYKNMSNEDTVHPNYKDSLDGFRFNMSSEADVEQLIKNSVVVVTIRYINEKEIRRKLECITVEDTKLPKKVQDQMKDYSVVYRNAFIFGEKYVSQSSHEVYVTHTDMSGSNEKSLHNSLVVNDNFKFMTDRKLVFENFIYKFSSDQGICFISNFTNEEVFITDITVMMNKSATLHCFKGNVTIKPFQVFVFPSKNVSALVSRIDAKVTYTTPSNKQPVSWQVENTSSLNSNGMRNIGNVSFHDFDKGMVLNIEDITVGYFGITVTNKDQYLQESKEIVSQFWQPSDPEGKIFSPVVQEKPKEKSIELITGTYGVSASSTDVASRSDSFSAIRNAYNDNQNIPDPNSMTERSISRSHVLLSQKDIEDNEEKKSEDPRVGQTHQLKSTSVSSTSPNIPTQTTPISTNRTLSSVVDLPASLTEVSSSNKHVSVSNNKENIPNSRSASVADLLPSMSKEQTSNKRNISSLDNVTQMSAVDKIQQQNHQDILAVSRSNSNSQQLQDNYNILSRQQTMYTFSAATSNTSHNSRVAPLTHVPSASEQKVETGRITHEDVHNPDRPSFGGMVREDVPKGSAAAKRLRKAVKIHTNGEHYWTFKVMVTSDRKPPHPSLYNGYNEDDGMPWTGCCLYVGRVDHVHGKRENDKINNARAGLHPTQDNDAYQHCLSVIDTMDIFFGVH